MSAATPALAGPSLAPRWIGRVLTYLLAFGLAIVFLIPFIWMLSSGWQDADSFRKVIRMYVEDRRKRDA